MICFAQVIGSSVNDNASANDASWSSQSDHLVGEFGSSITLIIDTNISEISNVTEFIFRCSMIELIDDKDIIN